MGTSLEQVAAVINKVAAGDMLGVCIDTCHAHSAGYDLSTPANVQNFFDQIEKTITLKKVICFHLNDSKTPFGSRKDRHENLGKGSIGEGGLAAFANLATKHNIPLILETPLINDSHLHDIKILKSWLQIK
jgi:deoxyribonuclease-4